MKRHRILFVVLVLTVLATNTAIVYTLVKPHPFDPLENVNPQEVTSRVPGVKGPAVRMSEEVKVIGTKCNTSEETVSVNARFEFRSVGPRGTIVPIGSSTAESPPGCETTSFSNELLPSVISRTKYLLAQGRKRVRWQIVGREVPLGRPEPVAEGWHTQTFSIVP